MEVLDRRPDKMRIKRKIPKNDVISEPVIEHSNLSSDGMKLEINDADEDTEDSKESIEDDSEMVIDETWLNAIIIVSYELKLTTP